MYTDYEFLDKTAFVKMKRNISNWNKTASIIYNTTDLDIIRHVLYVEKTVYSREYNKQRIYMRFSRVRSDWEKRHMSLFLKDVEVESTYQDVLKSQYTLAHYLKHWRVNINRTLALLKTEYEGQRRPHIMKALHSRLNKLRKKQDMVSMDGI